MIPITSGLQTRHRVHQKARGHPMEATGVAQIHDIYKQLIGDAPTGLQDDSPRVGLFGI
ncbi:MAG: hypothetical protein ACXADL_10360 [Candidatus Thorarchaeota archaeon]